MNKNYKIETKNTIFQVTLEEGCYSDYRMDVINISAISEEHCWGILCKLHATKIESKDLRTMSGLSELLPNLSYVSYNKTLESDTFGYFKNDINNTDYEKYDNERVRVSIGKLAVLYYDE